MDKPKVVPLRRSNRVNAGIPPRRLLQSFDLQRYPERRNNDQHVQCDQIISADVLHSENWRPGIADNSDSDIEVRSNGKDSAICDYNSIKNDNNGQEQLDILAKQIGDLSDKIACLSLNKKFPKAQRSVHLSLQNSPQRASTPIHNMMTAPVRSRIVVTPVRSQMAMSCDANVGRRMSASSVSGVTRLTESDIPTVKYTTAICDIQQNSTLKKIRNFQTQLQIQQVHLQEQRCKEQLKYEQRIQQLKYQQELFINKLQQEHLRSLQQQQREFCQQQQREFCKQQQKGLHQHRQQQHEINNNKARLDMSHTLSEMQSVSSERPVIAPARSYEDNRMNRYMARQTVGKDLPNFNGNPEDWLLFYTQYTRSTLVCGFTNDENLLRLNRCLSGAAKEAVRALLVMPDNVDTVIDTLQERFGRDEFVIKALIAKTKAIPAPREDRPDSIVSFATAVNNLVVTLTNLNRPEYLQNPQLIEDLESKLPTVMLMLWSNTVVGLERYTLVELSSWINRQAKAVGLRAIPKNYEDEKKRKPTHKVFATNEASDASSEENSPATSSLKQDVAVKVCSCCNKECVSLEKCEKFGNLLMDDRWKFIRSHGLCFVCFLRGHRFYMCRKRRKCGIDGCQQRHHKMLHSKSSEESTSSAKESNKSTETCTQTTTAESNVLLKIVPVILQYGNRKLETAALLDSGSTVTLLRADLADKLHADGPIKPLCIQWANGETCHEQNSQLLCVNISGCQPGAKLFEMNNVKTVRKLPLRKQSVNKERVMNDWPYLDGIPFSGYDNLQPGILLGEDNAYIMAPSKIVCDKANSPIATKTPLGWIISGNRFAQRENFENNQSFVYHACDEISSMDALHQLVKNSFAMDDFGLKSSLAKGRSKEDEKAMEIMNTTAVHLPTKCWEIGLLWRNSNVRLPDSRRMAEIRLKCLERKLDSNSSLKAAYGLKIQDYIDKAYFVKLDRQPVGDRIWYLPHFAVVNPNKPNKLRVVFDAASRSNGKSLNDFLMQGPDLLKSLPAVLFRFRQRNVAFVGDIKEMYHRVAIRQEDCESQLILWRGDDRKRVPDTYQMTAMTFGASCSPSAAMYVKDRNAAEYTETFPEAAHVIINNHYVDDCLASADDVPLAIKLIRDIMWIHAQGGFEIRNWSCSSSKVLETIPESLRAVVPLEIKTDQIERVLGLWWIPATDVFTFKFKHRNLINVDNLPTKRQVLSVIMSVYDPLGMLAHFIIKGKIIMQHVWKSGINWDDELTTNLTAVWQQWIRELADIEKVFVPRCYSPHFSSSSVIELHVFCDASEEAYCAVAYFRIINSSSIETSFIIAKSRVAPLKTSTIPRLELQAALIGSRLVSSIKDEHDIKPHRVCMWSDSNTVLCWIRADNRRFRQYVAQRVGEILEHTNVDDWKWVPSKHNVADDATRHCGLDCFEPNNRWFTGPSFLQLDETNWPQTEKFLPSDDVNLEVIENVFTVLTHDSLLKFERFSSALKTIRSVAWMLRFIWNYFNKQPQKSGNLDVDELKNAEIVCLQEAQKSCFSDELRCIRRRQAISKNSKINKLCTYLDDDGLLRIGSRLDKLNADRNYKNPVVLDGKHKFSEQLVEQFHSKCFHQNTATILNEIRQRFWIIGVKRTLKKITFECRVCRLRKTKPEQQLMGQLPRVRLDYGVHPFHYTGVDYFGPIDVVFGRRREKRYGVLFTCMTSRAVHLEVAASLSTDSFLMALRRFVARRGNPYEMFSDNGTNFRGANTELSKSIHSLNEESIKTSTASRGIKWSFIPPVSPHFGGCWERMVRSVKSSLAVTLKTKVPTDELLHTLLLEVEHIVNSRPLTDLPLNHTDDDVITPNHLLIGRSNGGAPVGIFTDSDLVLRKQWRASQRLADVFWSLWVKSYLPNLTLRSKWQKTGRKLAVGNVVLIADSNAPRNTWLKGIIVQVYPGDDGEVRVVDVKTVLGISKRPVHKICLLEIVSDI